VSALFLTSINIVFAFSSKINHFSSKSVIFIYYHSIKFIYMQKRCRFLIKTTSFLRHLELFLVILGVLTKKTTTILNEKHRINFEIDSMLF
jgi:hypothetical protein